ncbi:hypothetical protein D3C87_1957540 [compost metagenome]
MQQRRKPRPDEQVSDRVDRGDAHGAGWLVPEFGEGLQFGLDGIELRCYCRHQALAGFGRHHAARCASQQAHAHAAFQPADLVAQ